MLEHTRVKYQTAMDSFHSEGQIQWSRYNAILVVNTVFFAFLTLNKNFGLNYSQNLFYFLPIVGLFICILWHRMTDRGFIWMNHWIIEANNLEELLKGENNPVRNGDELRSKIGKNVTKNATLMIIKIFALLYLILAIINIVILIKRFNLF